MRTAFLVPLVLSAFTGAVGCASKLPYEKTTHAPEGMGLEAQLDLSLVELKDVRTGDAINLKTYMDANEREYVLLTFGSKSCTACNRKNDYFKNYVIGQHPMFLSEAGKHFEIIGVNTDPDPYERLQGYLSQYSWIKWSDPAGLVMLDYFMPQGARFRVPLTVMVTKDGIAWRVMPDDHISERALVDKVELSLAGRPQKPEPTPGTDDGASEPGDGDGSGDTGGDGDDTGNDQGDGGDDQGDGGNDQGDGGLPTADAADLAAIAPGRFQRVDVTDCAGQPATVDKVLGGTKPDLRFIAVTQGACGTECQDNLATLQAAMADCEAAGKHCAVASLSTEAPDANVCASGLAYQGGAAFFNVFKSHFDWNYTITENPDYTLVLPAVEGPLLLAFAADGTLVYSHERTLPAGALGDVIRAAAPLPAVGPDFALFTKDTGVFGFAERRLKAQYSIVASVGVYPVPCGSCIDELVRWSEPNQLYDFCSERPTFCQLLYVDYNYPDRPGQTLAQFYDIVVNGDGRRYKGLAANKIRIPLILDPNPKNGDDGQGYLKRMFDGYMLAARPDWKTDPRTFVYDREGKIVAQFRSESPGDEEPVLAKMQRLLENGGN